MADEGNGFPWHFDTNNFTVTLAIQNAEEGGAFEYAPNIRANGENFDEVKAVLDERSDRVVRLDLEPGDLQLFRGRYSLHRVAPLYGKRPRYVAILSYVEEPDMVGGPEGRCLYRLIVSMQQAQPLPYLNLKDPNFSTKGQEVKAAQAAGWCAETPFGLAVLRYRDFDKEAMRGQIRIN